MLNDFKLKPISTLGEPDAVLREYGIRDNGSILSIKNNKVHLVLSRVYLDVLMLANNPYVKILQQQLIALETYQMLQYGQTQEPMLITLFNKPDIANHYQRVDMLGVKKAWSDYYYYVLYDIERRLSE